MVLATSFQETSKVTDQKKNLEFIDSHQVDATIYQICYYATELNFELSVKYIKQVCCTVILLDKEMIMLNETFSLRCSLSETEESTFLHMLLGSFIELLLQKNLMLRQIFQAQNLLVCYLVTNYRIHFSEIFELSCVLYCYYKNLKESCVDCLLQAACFSLKMQIEIKSWENFQIF